MIQFFSGVGSTLAVLVVWALVNKHRFNKAVARQLEAWRHDGGVSTADRLEFAKALVLAAEGASPKIHREMLDMAHTVAQLAADELNETRESA